MDEDKLDHLHCPVCMDEFSDPRLLPCHHTVCSYCIHCLLQSSTSARMFRCPQCRHNVSVPRGGISQLPINFSVRSLQDKLGDEANVRPCQICQNSISSKFHCIDCDLDICRFCIHHHRLVLHKESGVVNILRLESGIPLGGGPATASKACSVHTDAHLQFCETCQHSVCVICNAEQHHKHDIIPLGEKLYNSRNDLQKQLESLTRERRDVRAQLRQLEEEEEEAKDNTTRTLVAVQHRARELHGLVDKMSAAVMEKTRYEEQQQLTKLSTCLGPLITLTQRLDLGADVLCGLQEEDVSLELLDAFKVFSLELDEIRKNAKSCSPVQVCDQNFLAGCHLQLRGYLAATFGSLRARYSFLHFGNGKPHWWSYLWRQPSIIQCAKMLLLLAMLYTIVIQSAACYHSPADAKCVIALIFTIYLTLSACFAFRKAK